MKIPWSSVLAVAKAIYMAFLHGKVVTLPWGIGPVTLPSEEHSIPLGLYDAHRTAAVGLPPLGPLTATQRIKPLPEGMELPRDERRTTKRRADERREDGLPEPVPPEAPLSVKTLGFLLFIIFGLPLIGLTMMGALEWQTLSDDIPGNHITATVRAAWARDPGAVLMALLVWFAFLAFIVGGLLAHFFFK